MITVVENAENALTLNFDLPQGNTAQQLIEQMLAEIEQIISTKIIFGKIVNINGRITTAMCIALGHKLAHVCKEVRIFIPQENTFLTCIKH